VQQKVLRGRNQAVIRITARTEQLRVGIFRQHQRNSHCGNASSGLSIGQTDLQEASPWRKVDPKLSFPAFIRKVNFRSVTIASAGAEDRVPSFFIVSVDGISA
jgi:hypothetical protein